MAPEDSPAWTEALFPPGKLSWSGQLLAVQPRIRLIRSFDERSHAYPGFSLWIRGTVVAAGREFSVGVGPAAHAKHAFKAGDTVRGCAVAVADRRLEPVELYKASALEVITRAPSAASGGPPWLGVAPPLEVYRTRGHRRLDPRTYRASCRACIWGCRMPVEIIIDKWNPRVREFRFETFCYGPKSCPAYRAGPTRKVPGRKGMVWEEEDWIDAEVTSHRGMDE